MSGLCIVGLLLALGLGWISIMAFTTKDKTE